MGYVCDALYAVLYVHVSCFVVLIMLIIYTLQINLYFVGNIVV